MRNSTYKKNAKFAILSSLHEEDDDNVAENPPIFDELVISLGERRTIPTQPLGRRLAFLLSRARRPEIDKIGGERETYRVISHLPLGWATNGRVG